MRILAPSLVAVAVLLAGCGSDTAETDTATDPTSASGTPTPTADPTVGSYPSFAPKDYTYTLHVSCFCADAQAGIRVTVVEGQVTDAVYDESGRGVHEGDPVDDFRRLSINDVIDAANDTEAARVDVTWPAGQDYPSRVFVDQSLQMADEEIGYTVSEVSVG